MIILDHNYSPHAAYFPALVTCKPTWGWNPLFVSDQRTAVGANMISCVWYDDPMCPSPMCGMMSQYYHLLCVA